MTFLLYFYLTGYIVVAIRLFLGLASSFGAEWRKYITFGDIAITLCVSFLSWAFIIFELATLVTNKIKEYGLEREIRNINKSRKRTD